MPGTIYKFSIISFNFVYVLAPQLELEKTCSGGGPSTDFIHLTGGGGKELLTARAMLGW